MSFVNTAQAIFGPSLFILEETPDFSQHCVADLCVEGCFKTYHTKLNY
jgi:hypothetical protein